MKFFGVRISGLLAALLIVSAVPCVRAGGQKQASGGSQAQAKTVVFQIGYENNPGEPIDLAVNRWKELVDQKGDGSIRIELYPSSQLGSKNDLLDQMVAGEPVGTLCDGTFYADRGVPDFGILFGPYMFDNWDQCWKLIGSSWWDEQCKKLENQGIKIITANWIYGERHTLTVRPVKSVADLKGMKLRVPNNTIQVKGTEVLGASPTPMALGEVYTSLQQKTIDGLENPLPVLYGGKFHEVAKYLILDGHILNATTWICGTKFWNSLTPAQQEFLKTTGDEAGLFNNQMQNDAVAKTVAAMKAEGVTIYEPTPAVKEEFRKAAEPFYSLPEFASKWSPNLYNTVKAAMK
jgi:tripartite ATP-independent transporter DctP family solute receptor